MLMVNHLIGFSTSASLTTATLGTWGTTSSTDRDIGTSGDYGGFQFTAPQTGVVTQVRFEIASVGTAGNFTLKLYSDSADHPNTQIGSDGDTINVSTTGIKTWTFPTPPSITSGSKYWIILQTSGSTVSQLKTVANNASYGSGRNDTVTSIGTTDLTSSEDWLCEVTYRY